MRGRLPDRLEEGGGLCDYRGPQLRRELRPRRRGHALDATLGECVIPRLLCAGVDIPLARRGGRGRGSSRGCCPFGPFQSLPRQGYCRVSLLLSALGLGYLSVRIPEALPPPECRLHGQLQRSLSAG